MPKYSTGGGGNNVDDSCQLCGETDGRMSTEKIAGAQVTVCNQCRPNTSSDSQSDDETSEKKSKKVKMGNTRGYTISQPNPDWVGNVDYGNKTPYLRQNYAKAFQEALDMYDGDVDKLVDDAGVSAETIQALNNGEATSKGITAEELQRLEKALEITLIEYEK